MITYYASQNLNITNGCHITSRIFITPISTSDGRDIIADFLFHLIYFKLVSKEAIVLAEFDYVETINSVGIMISLNLKSAFNYCFVTTILCIVGVKNDQQDATASMIFTGDISFDGPVKYFAEIQKTCNYRRPFEKVKPFLYEADLRIGNLESALLEQPYGLKPAIGGKLIYHYGSHKAVDGLKYAGFDVLQLANNHITDFDSKGVESTTKALKNAGIDYVGLRSDHDRKRSQIPLIKVVNGIKIGFLAYCQNKEGCDLYQCNENECGNSSSVFKRGPAILDKEKARYDITALKKKVDRIVVLLHWSRELSLMPPMGIRDIAKLLKIFGANLIIGGHPHVIQVNDNSL